MGGTNNDAGYALNVDASGNVFVSGPFAGTVDFNPGTGVNNLVSSGQSDGFILKLDTNGNYVWAQRMGSPDAEYSYNIAFDAAGNVLLAGYIGTGTATFGSLSITSAGAQDGFVAKLNSAGVFQWVKRIGGTSNDIIYGIETDNAGNIYVGGGSELGNTTGLATLTQRGSFILKLDNNGNFVWSHQNPQGSYYRNIRLDALGNVYGAVSAPVAGAPTLVKVDNAGVTQWSKRLGDGANYLSIGPDNNVYITGVYTGTATLGSTTFTAAGSNDIFVAKVDAAGNVAWAKSIGGPLSDQTYWISADHAGEVLVGGFFRGTADFDPNECVYDLSSPGPTSGYVVKLTDKLLPDGFAVSPSTIAPLTQQACSLGIPNVITGNAVGVTAPAGYTTTIVYQWQKSTSASGPWEDMPGEVFKDLQPLASSEPLYYRRLVKAGTNFCGVFQTADTSAVATVTVGANTAPTANADGPQWFVCSTGS
ncbi:SBBP repeat-containing protein, partial [Dyadobacter crusticola]|uniref:SBBP repeat-containing protein n=1 Tax=Dyadobacter crusticola TaxID=292407 RepID=UPI00196A19C3